MPSMNNIVGQDYSEPNLYKITLLKIISLYIERTIANGHFLIYNSVVICTRAF